MDKRKPTMITLVVPERGMKREFDIDHAERLLRMENNGGWQLPEDSNFNFDFANGLKQKTNSRHSEKPE